MGKSQSKLSSDQLADLQKNTYCKPIPAHPTRTHISAQSTRRSYSNGTLFLPRSLPMSSLILV